MPIARYLNVISFVVMGLLPISLYAKNGPAATVYVVPAQLKQLSPVTWVSGTVASHNDSQLAVEVSGRLMSLVELGAEVKKNDVIARIDDTTEQFQLNEDIAAVAKAQSHLAFIESEVERNSTLEKRKLTAKTNLDQLISQRDIAKADLTVAKAQVAKTQQRITYSQLKAPFDGLVTERLSNQGEYVESGTAMVRLVEMQNLEGVVFSPLTAYRYLNQADSLAIKSPLGKGIARIKSLVPVADSRSHLMEVRLDMSPFDWPVGLSIQAAVANGDAKQVLAVPRDALVIRRDGISIFRINGDSTAEQIQVAVGIGVGEYVEVIADIEAGDRIVVRGAETLRPAQVVNVKSDNHKLVSGNQ